MMKLVGNMSESRKEKFQSAILQSLDMLLESGAIITKQKVIRNAKFDDGCLVGETTLYSRHKVTKEFVHQKLLKKIDDVIDKQRKRKTGKSDKETKTYLNKHIRELKHENKKLLTQIVEQESRIKLAEKSMTSDNNVVKSQEIEVYVLSKIVNELSNGAVEDFRLLVERFETKYRSSEILMSAQKEISRYLNQVVQSKLVSLDSVKKIKSISNETNL